MIILGIITSIFYSGLMIEPFMFSILGYLIWLAFYIILSLSPGFHRYIHWMAVMFSFIPFVFAGMMLEHDNISNAFILRTLITLQVTSMFIIYPLIIALGVFINHTEEKLGIPKQKSMLLTQKKSYKYLHIVLIVYFVLESLLIVTLAEDLNQGSPEPALFLWYLLLHVSYFFMSIIFNYQYMNLNEISRFPRFKKVKTHFLFIMCLCLFIIFVHFNHRLDNINLGEIGPYSMFFFPITTQLMAFVMFRYLAGMMREYKPFYLIFIPTITIHGLFVGHIFYSIPASFISQIIPS